MNRDHGLLTLALVALGAGWGLTQPLTKISVTGGYEPFGIIFWQMLIGTLLLGGLRWRTLGRLPVTPRRLAFWLMIAARHADPQFQQLSRGLSSACGGHVHRDLDHSADRLSVGLGVGQ